MASGFSISGLSPAKPSPCQDRDVLKARLRADLNREVGGKSRSVGPDERTLCSISWPRCETR